MAGKIDTIQLNDGTSIPWLAWGNGTGEAKRQALEAGKLVLKAGINHIDTAQVYQTEPETLQAVQQTGSSRSSIWVTSKIAVALPTDEEVRRSVEGSIKKLGGPPELFLIHNPYLEARDRLLPTWKILEQMKDEGKLKSIGVSNFRPQDLEMILKDCKYKPSVNQLEYHPFVLQHLEPLISLHEKHGIVIESFGPLTPLLRHPSQGGPLKPVLAKIASRLSSTTGENIDEYAVLLLWCKAHSVVAITASGHPERIQMLARVARLDSKLTKQEVAEIDEIGKRHHFRYYTEHMITDFPAPDLPEE